MKVTFPSVLADHGRRGLREHALRIAAAALEDADPAAAFRDRVRVEGDDLVVLGAAAGERPGDASRLADTAGERRFPLAGRHVWLLGAGKATMDIAQAIEELLGERLSGGVVVVKEGQGTHLRSVEVVEAAHPIPDERSLRAGRRLLGCARQAAPADLVLAVVTGGSSALAVVPGEGITLADKVATNRLLLGCGADITHINAVRKHISAIKGGRLGAACGCDILNFTVSDVVGDQLDVLTDLTVPDSSSFALAQETCTRWHLWGRLPRVVAERLRRADPRHETVRRLTRVTSYVLADAAVMCTAAARQATQLGYRAEVLTLALEGESAVAGRDLAAALRAAAPGAALIAGGETTVSLSDPPAALCEAATLRPFGGPSQEAALAAAVALAGGGPAALLCIDSDGSDGPTAAAGGLVDDLTAERARAAGVDPSAALAAHATHDALAAVGDLIVTGPTGTNVNDLRIGLTTS